MANEIVVRPNFVSGTITNNPLAIGGTTLNSAALANLPAIGSTQFCKIILDPLGAGTGPEVVYVTAHTASAASATIVRGREGTSAVQHATGTVWVAGPLASDWTLVGNTADRPSTGGLPYDGQVFSNVEINGLEVYNQGNTAWQQIGPLAAWSAWAPVITQSSTPSQSYSDSSYMRVGRLIIAVARISFTGAGTASNPIYSTWPVVPKSYGSEMAVGSFMYFDSGTTVRAGTCMFVNIYGVGFNYDGYGNKMGNGDFTIANGDTFTFQLIYEAAA
ncbi:MAG: hypothetical protein FJ038_04295 [Chloroflexi bacterium]|nr:hypothetical protein [Chloroflexota bacterium]